MSNICNPICEQIFLEQFAHPSIIDSINNPITWTIKATNISGKSINKSLVISSSLCGTLLLSGNGIKSGETLTVECVYNPSFTDIGVLNNVVFAAYGDINSVGTRISPVIITSVTIKGPEPIDVTVKLNVTGSIYVNKYYSLVISVENIGTIACESFDILLDNITGNRPPPGCLLDVPEGVVGVINNSLLNGYGLSYKGIIAPGTTKYLYVLYNTGCVRCDIIGCCIDNPCPADYTGSGIYFGNLITTKGTARFQFYPDIFPRATISGRNGLGISNMVIENTGKIPIMDTKIMLDGQIFDGCSSVRITKGEDLYEINQKSKDQVILSSRPGKILPIGGINEVNILGSNCESCQSCATCPKCCQDSQCYIRYALVSIAGKSAAGSALFYPY